MTGKAAYLKLFEEDPTAVRRMAVR